jgi:hypothetical protein
MSGLVTLPDTSNEETCRKAEIGDVLHALREAEESTLPIFCHLEGTDMSLDLNRKRIKAGNKRYA